MGYVTYRLGVLSNADQTPHPIVCEQSAWDTSFVEQLYGGKNEVTVAHELLEKFQGRTTEWQAGTVEAWINETHQLARSVAYGMLPGFDCETDLEAGRITLPADYIQAAERIVEEQLAKGGYRLAWMLNRVLGE
jgi:S1/P1 Nuclease